ncbi:NUDIX domain-containing protein [Brevirhabdus sp.]|uniref:NUDIX domain-containing protein n=1 Tax=Brevirhabdus sp. TaxID=2004514 RepID=UPI0040586413
MTPLFLFGSLRHLPLLGVVLDRPADDIERRDATLYGYSVYWALGQGFPLPMAEAGGSTSGWLLTDLSADDVARLDFYEAGFGYRLFPVQVESGGAQCDALVYLPPAGLAEKGGRWTLEEWVARWGDLSVAAAGEFMAHFGTVPPEDLAPRFAQMRARAQSRLSAAVSRPSPVGRGGGRADVEVAQRRLLHDGFFQTAEYELRHRRFDGAESGLLSREVFVAVDAVTVLPYDPVRDRVLLVEQFRISAYARGDAHPWTIEAIAGRRDPGESAARTAQREAKEEAGIELRGLERIASYYPSTGALTEHVESFVGFADLSDAQDRWGGVTGEGEDIRAFVLDWADVADLMASDQIDNAPLLLSLQWLLLNKARLRAER